MNTTKEHLVIQEGPAEGVIRLVMNRPESFNALSSDMLTALDVSLTQASETVGCKVIILAALGKAFCAGHDLREMRANPEKAFYQQLFDQCSKMMLKLQTLKQPVVAQVQGLATAAGCQLVSMCDLAVAADSAKFAVSGINYGLFCSTPSVGLSRNMPRKQAMEMLLTGEFIDASTAVDRGLINYAVADAELNHAVLKLCSKITAKPEAALQMGKALFYNQLEMGIQAAYQLAGQTMACNMMEVTAQEGFQAFIEKRQPDW